MHPSNPLLYKPKNYDEYTDEHEKNLVAYFSTTLGWGSKVTSRAVFEFLIDVRRFAEGKTVLDAGAGYKRFAPFFSNARYLTLEHPAGISLKSMGEIGYDYIAELDGDSFAEPDSVDVIYNHSVLEHIERPEKFFRNAFSVLKSGGRLCICVPFIHMEHEIPYDFQRFTRYGLRSRLEEAGFNILRLDPSSNAFYAVAAMLQTGLLEDSRARGVQVENYRLPDGHVYPLIPLLKDIAEKVNAIFDDAIYDTLHASGFLCVAEKP